jgi:uncharacterized protein (DUF302 family)
MAAIGLRRAVKGSFDEVLARIPAVLKAQGYGVLSQIDMKRTLEEKLGVEFRRYQILGVSNPSLAYRALVTEPAAGSLLPCSIAVWEEKNGGVTVNVVNPLQTFGSLDPTLQPIAQESQEALARALAAL